MSTFLRPKNYFLFLLIAFFFQASSLLGKPANLTPQQTLNKAKEILSSHATPTKIDNSLISKLLPIYLEELDPLKLYFLHDEINSLHEPTPQLATEVTQQVKKGDFSFFFDVSKTFKLAAERRSQLELEIKDIGLPENVDVDEFTPKKMQWAKTPEELKQRLAKVKSLQLQSIEKIKPSESEGYFDRLNRYKTKKEAEIIGTTTKEAYLSIYSSFLKAMCKSLDSHTTYFTPDEAKTLLIQMEQRLFGIGAILRDDITGILITQLIDGGPAKKDNLLRENDRIIAIDKEPTIGFDLAESVEKIRGQKGTPVLLTIKRTEGDAPDSKESIFDVEIIRDEVQLKEGRYKATTYPFGDGSIAHLQLHSFYSDKTTSSSKDLRQFLTAAQGKGKLHGVILDLRNNMGGLLSEAVEVTGLFIKSGIVVSVKNEQNQLQHLRVINESPAFSGPLIVLINKASASASEIAALSLQDYGRALIVGDERSFGKGTFQTVSIDMQQQKINPLGEYKVTKGIYYTAGGKSPQKQGVKPDILIPGILSHLEIGEEYEKHPLASQTIPPQFYDTMSDIQPLQRFKLRSIYNKSQARVSDSIKSYLPLLSQNAEERLSTHTSFQKQQELLKQKKSLDIEHDTTNDYQLEETLNLMKDFIWLTNAPKLHKAS